MGGGTFRAATRRAAHGPGAGENVPAVFAQPPAGLAEIRPCAGRRQRSRQASAQVIGGETIELAPPPAADVAAPQAQRMALAIVFEDDDLIVIDKPAGLVVHPGAGNPDRTLLNALLAHAPALRQVPRAGIVHRLDKDTSGLLVVAKNLTAQARLAAQLAARSVKRTYLALVHGAPPAHGTIDAPIGRDTRARTRMAVTQRGKEARTSYRVLERFAQASAAAWSNAAWKPGARTRSACTCSTSATRSWAIRSTAAARGARRRRSRARRCTRRSWNSCIRARGKHEALERAAARGHEEAARRSCARARLT